MPHRRTFFHTSHHKSASTYRHSYSSVKKLDMTEGPLFGKILLFVLPLMVTNLLQVFYNAADMVIASMSSEPDAVGAIGTTGAFVNLVVNIFMGFATGANVVIARYLGAKDDVRASRATHTALSMSLIFGAVSGAVGVMISHPVLSAMGAQGKLLDLAVTYTVIYFIGLPFIAASNYLIAIYRAKGDTRTPLFVLSFTGLCNVLMNLFFVKTAGLSVEGVALATSIANALSALLLGFKLSKDDTACRFSFKKLCIDRRLFKEILNIGLPAGIQGSLFSISNMLISSSILQINNSICPPGSAFQPVVKGNAAMANLDGFVYTAQNTTYQAAITFTSQNAGAGKHERVFKIRRCCFAIGIFISLAISAVMTLFPETFLSFYGVVSGAEGSLEQIAYETALIRIQYVTLLYFFIVFMEVGSGIARGLGKSFASMIISLLGACAFRVVWILTVFRIWPTLQVLYLSFPISWIASGIAFSLYATIILKKQIRQRDAALQ